MQAMTHSISVTWYHGNGELKQEHQIRSQSIEARSQVLIGQLVQFGFNLGVGVEQIHQVSGHPCKSRWLDGENRVGVQRVPQWTENGRCEAAPDQQAGVLVVVPPRQVDAVVLRELLSASPLVVHQLKVSNE